MKKNNTAEKTVLDAENLTKALKEGTEKSLRDIMNEAISKMVRESEDEDELEDDSFDVEDVETEETPKADEIASEETPAEEPEEGEGEEGSDEGDADDEWSDMEEYKVGDNDYDFTGVDEDEVLKVYNKLGDDDQIFVKKEDDGTYSVKDDETGAEFVIELNPDALDAENAEEGSNEGEDETLDANVDGENADDDSELDIEFDDENGDDSLEFDLPDEGEESKDELDEDLGYTDSYQKDVFDKKPNMSEPANASATYSMDGGAPKGAEKPWAGKGDGEPFEKEVNEEVDECDVMSNPNEEANLEEDGNGLNTKHANKKSTNHINRGAQNQRQSSEDGEYKALRESVTKVVEKAREIQAENKQYKSYLDRIKKSVCEQATLNANLIRLVDILVNETTTKDEKKSICERFNAVKTVAEGKELYAKIKTELKESKTTSSPIVEKQFSASSTDTLNENVIYQNRESNPALNLMDRMDNLFKK